MPLSSSPVICKRNALAVACGVGLLLTASVEAAPREGTLGSWREYARHGVMPEYSWNHAKRAAVPTVLSSLRQARNVRSGAPRSAFGSPFAARSLRYSTAPAGYDPAAISPVSGLLSRDRSVINNELVASSLGRDLGAAGQLELTAVVAHQRYASAGFGTAPWIAREDLTGLRSDAAFERSTGHGVRLAYSAPIDDGLSWNLNLQSRLAMDAFESFRGVYADAGDFDLPARVQTQLQWDVSHAAVLAFGVERVFYSDISAFTSATLPTRFLSLLGDGSSPEFAWRDLTIYSVEGAFADTSGAEWSLRYTTRQQPSPTSALLERAMQREFTDTNVALGYRRELGAMGQLWLAASYAPSRYFLGASPYAQRNIGSGSQVELEVLWSIPF